PIGHCSIIQKRDREGRRIGSHHPAGRIDRTRIPFACAHRRWDRNYSALIRPDERQTGALVQHARPNYITGVTHAKRKRSVEPRQRAHLEGTVLPDIINDSHVARSIRWIDALTHDTP